ncbi:MAG: GatB/YqeY domain-containing protein [Mollicutes bacterium]|nr:GatB/YqeY domain-containing protein [Mollicutes bacterium]
MFEKINQAIIEAMKNKNKDIVDVLRMLKGAIQLEEINKKIKLTDDDIALIVSKQIKMRKESISEFEKGNRQDLISKTQSEIEILNDYLPNQLTEQEVNDILDSAIKKLEVDNPSQMGLVMREVSPLLKGKTEMSQLSVIIKEKLSSK